MKIASFNINNINRCLTNLLDWLREAEPDWAAYAPGLKTHEDATESGAGCSPPSSAPRAPKIRRSERAWMTFVIVGGGPTGVELAGAIAELARHGLDKEFRSIDPAAAARRARTVGGKATSDIPRGALDRRRRDAPATWRNCAPRH
jgi:hypothetical protein